MSLGLLAPSALGLMVLLGLPVLAHLTRQRPTDRLAFGAMLLVQRLVKRLRRRRSLKDRLLFALRLLAMLLALLAAAGPQLSWTGAVPDFEGSGRVVLVVDTSMSMALHDGGSTLLERAKAAASTRVRSAPDGVRFGLVAYDAAARPLTGELTADKGHVLAQIEALETSLHPGDLRGALLEARRMLEGEPGEVVLYSDEAGAVMVPHATEEIGRLVEAGSAVLPEPVLAEPPRNLTVLDAVYGDGLEGGQVTFRVQSYGPDTAETTCEVRLPDGASIAVFVTVPPLGEAEARVTVPREARGGVASVRCEDPDLPLDDTRWFHLPQVGASRVLVVDGDPGDTPTQSEIYFLERALSPWGGLKSGVALDVVSPKGFDRLDRDVHRLVFLANVADPVALGPALREHVRRGGVVVVAVGDNVTPERYAEALGPVLPAPFRRIEALADRGEDPVPLALPEVDHPLFEPFARGGREGLARIGAWRVMTLEPYADGGDVHTLLRYVDGMPALVERRVGQGAVLVWTSTLDDGWTNLPFEAAFLPLVQRLVSLYGGEALGTVLRRTAVVGDTVEVELEEGVRAVDVLGPLGEPVRFSQSGSSVLLTPDRPGAYEVRITDGPTLAWVAVNLDTEESDVRRTHSVARAEAELVPELFTRHRDLALPALMGALALVLAAALLALRPGVPA
ncbi:MAG: VWA domain-containing protein [Alphaproteobacteria bacterium]|nr:VWA domain-containing protein [Alphaproteobacteria bacterium]